MGKIAYFRRAPGFSTIQCNQTDMKTKLEIEMFSEMLCP